MFKKKYIIFVICILVFSFYIMYYQTYLCRGILDLFKNIIKTTGSPLKFIAVCPRRLYFFGNFFFL